MWLRAGQAAACFNPSLIAFNRLIVASSSPALAVNIRRSMLGFPSGENMDRIYVYLTGLIDKAKEELGMARSGGQSADSRRHALKQHVDEIAAYLKAQALQVDLPRTYPQQEGSAAGGHYVLEDVPAFFGRVKCVLDQWYDSHLLSLYDEVLMLVKPKGAKPAGAPSAS